MLLLSVWFFFFSEIFNSGKSVSSSFAYTWDSFSTIGLALPALMWGTFPCLTVFGFAMFDFCLLSPFLREMEVEWIGEQGDGGREVADRSGEREDLFGMYYL